MVKQLHFPNQIATNHTAPRRGHDVQLLNQTEVMAELTQQGFGTRET